MLTCLKWKTRKINDETLVWDTFIATSNSNPSCFFSFFFRLFFLYVTPARLYTGGRQGVVGRRGGEGGREGPAEAPDIARGSGEDLEPRGQRGGRWLAEGFAAAWAGHRIVRVVGLRARQHRALHTENDRRRNALQRWLLSYNNP